MVKLSHRWKSLALWLLMAATVGCGSAQGPARAQNWPSKPVKVIMATAAGSAPDVTARIVTDRLAQIWVSRF
jgi:tripartite-type tricarboxylate transporter receptor subunit TctC